MKNFLRLIPLYLLIAVLIITLAGCQKPTKVNIILPESTSTPAQTEDVTISLPPEITPDAAPSPTPDTASPTPEATPTPTPEPSPTPTIETVHTTSIFKHEEGVPYYADLDNDGEDEQIIVYLEDTEYGRDIIQLSVTDEGETSIVEVGHNFPSVYFCENTNGEMGVIISFDPASDDNITKVYKFDGTTPIETCCIGGRITNTCDECIEMWTYVYAFGTWSANAMYTVSDDFMLEPAGSCLWNIELNEYNNPLTALKPVPVQMMENGTYVDAHLPEGTIIWPTATDNKSIFLFETEDGQQGKIEYTFDCYSYIDGVVDTEWFDGIGYFG